jgi:hypothetical protein
VAHSRSVTGTHVPAVVAPVSRPAVMAASTPPDRRPSSRGFFIQPWTWTGYFLRLPYSCLLNPSYRLEPECST